MLEPPKLLDVQSNNDNSKLTLEKLNLDELKTAQKFLSTIHLHSLEAPENSTNQWVGPTLSTTALVCGILLYIGWKKWNKPVLSQRNLSDENRKTISHCSPYFPNLRREKLCDVTRPIARWHSIFQINYYYV